MERLDYRPVTPYCARRRARGRGRVAPITAVIQPIPTARIRWEGEQPYSADYEDIYFSHDAAEEVERVFLAPANIDFSAPDTCVVEFGFGSGLNFACCYEKLLAYPSSRLHFVSFEAHPLSATDWREVSSRHPHLSAYSELVSNPLPALTGWYRRVMGNGRITLTVFHGDVREGMQHFAAHHNTPIDAWFLDGFAPSRNQAMWHRSLFETMADLSTPGTTVTTFTAAGQVRRDLTAAGFAMSRIDQRPLKRESLVGRYVGKRRQPRDQPKLARVFGAGIGGACVARHLADHGVYVQLYDPNGIASGASKISHAVMHARLLGDASTQADLRVASFHYATNYLANNKSVNVTGVRQITGPNLNLDKLQRIARNYAADHPDQAHWIEAQGDSALHYPTAGTINIPKACVELIDHDNIEVINDTPSIDQSIPTVLCNGMAAKDTHDWLEIVEVHGQLDTFAIATGDNLNQPFVGSGYVVPSGSELILGSTYEYSPWSPEQATQHNLSLNEAVAASLSLKWRGRQRAARAISSDRAPIAGKLADNLWISTAFGSMGTTAAPIAADLVVGEMLGHAPILSDACRAVLHPHRFIERQARRGRRY